MRKFVWVLGILLLIPVSLFGQATSTSKLAWDQPANLLSDANGFTYRYYPDNAATGITLANVTCTGTVTPFQCSVAFPAFTPGPHTLQLTAANAAGEGVKSNPFAFTFVVVPSAPANIHIQ